ncbi:MAG: isocitrate/isopropylmalate dehydrogenase family protein [Anaerolineae bacterium]|nr:isocitrate/isopropylmalate dehydrogenase family protein [Anaerolineae bacterium]
MPRLCVIEGDGIGREVIPAAVEVLQAILPDLEIVKASAGWETFKQCGVSVPEETLAAVRECGAALFGAVSSPSRKVEGYRSAILTLRQELGLYANIRPVCSLPAVSHRGNVNLVIVRENTEGLYAGRERLEGDTAIAERVITSVASRRIALRAAEVLRLDGRRRVTIVHKANVLPVTDGLFRDTVRAALEKTRQPYEDWEIDEMLVDTAAYKLAAAPQNLDVLVTTNLFGDILSDEAAHWCGGMGLAPSLNWGDHLAVAEPVHGSAPDIAGKGIANPIAAILSAALLARYHWKMPAVADGIERAVHQALAWEIREDGRIPPALRTEEITSAILRQLEHAL